LSLEFFFFKKNVNIAKNLRNELLFVLFQITVISRPSFLLYIGNDKEEYVACLFLVIVRRVICLSLSWRVVLQFFFSGAKRVNNKQPSIADTMPMTVMMMMMKMLIFIYIEIEYIRTQLKRYRQKKSGASKREREERTQY
jgi:hypothetical protein